MWLVYWSMIFQSCGSSRWDWKIDENALSRFVRSAVFRRGWTRKIRGDIGWSNAQLSRSGAFLDSASTTFVDPDILYWMFRRNSWSRSVQRASKISQTTSEKERKGLVVSEGIYGITKYEFSKVMYKTPLCKHHWQKLELSNRIVESVTLGWPLKNVCT